MIVTNRNNCIFSLLAAQAPVLLLVQVLRLLSWWSLVAANDGDGDGRSNHDHDHIKFPDRRRRHAIHCNGHGQVGRETNQSRDHVTDHGLNMVYDPGCGLHDGDDGRDYVLDLLHPLASALKVDP